MADTPVITFLKDRGIHKYCDTRAINAFARMLGDDFEASFDSYYELFVRQPKAFQAEVYRAPNLGNACYRQLSNFFSHLDQATTTRSSLHSLVGMSLRLKVVGNEFHLMDARGSIAMKIVHGRYVYDADDNHFKEALV